MKYVQSAGRSLNKGDTYSEYVCPSCEGKDHLVLSVTKRTALLRCQCGAVVEIERPILFKKVACHPE